VVEQLAELQLADGPTGVAEFRVEELKPHVAVAGVGDDLSGRSGRFQCSRGPRALLAWLWLSAPGPFLVIFAQFPDRQSRNRKTYIQAVPMRDIPRGASPWAPFAGRCCGRCWCPVVEVGAFLS
jgi:hypothetical protein